MTLPMRQEEYRPVPDGTRPLTVNTAARQSRSLVPSYVDPRAGLERTCFSALFAERVPEFGRPATCRIGIVAGDHYLEWIEHDVAGKPTGNTFAYCAPCAVSCWELVTEADV